MLHVLKAFENALESQLKYITGCRAWNNFCVCLDQWCSRERNLWGQDLVKTSRPRLHQKLRDSRLEIWDRDSRRQNLSILPKFWLNVVITSEFNFFFISGIVQRVLVVSYLQIQQTKKRWILEISLNYFFAIFKVSRPVTFETETRPETFQTEPRKNGSRHSITGSDIDVHCIYYREYWFPHCMFGNGGLAIWSWSRDFPFFESQSRRFEFLFWSRSQVHSVRLWVLQKYGLVKLL